MSSSSSPASEVAHHGASDHCLNCGTLLAPGAKFCHACGQDTANHPPSLFEFVHEFVAHYVALEGALWRSLKGLAFRPGFLTLEYLAGRKTRYVLPLRLLLTLGFVFFLLVKVTPSGPEDQASAAELSAAIHEEEDTAAPEAASGSASATLKRGAKVAARAPSAAASQGGASGLTIDTNSAPELQEGVPAWLRPQFEAAKQRWKKDSSAESERLKAKVRGLLPYAVLCSLPFFAGILALVFWWRRYTYGAHFVFAMHLHAFFYLALGVLFVMPVEALAWAVFAWLMVYPLLAIKRVYAQSWRGAVGSSAVVFVLHALLQLLMFLSVFAIGALSP